MSISDSEYFREKNQYWLEGMKAREENISTNPHAPGSREATAWDGGYNVANVLIAEGSTN